MGASYEKVILSHSIPNHRFHYIPLSACRNWLCSHGSDPTQASAGERRPPRSSGETAGEGAGKVAGAAGGVGSVAGSRAGGSGTGNDSAGAEGGGGTTAGGAGAGDYRGRAVDQSDVCRFDGRRQHRRRGSGHPAGGGG